MKSLKMKLFGLFIACGIVAACSVEGDEGYCNTIAGAETTIVTGPETVAINDTITFDTTFNILNDCGAFSGFSASTGFPKQVVPMVSYVGCKCEAEITSVTKEFKFKATQAGTFEFRFPKADGTFHSKTVTVTE